MSPLLSTAGAAFAIHTPPPPPVSATLFGLLHHTFAGASPLVSLEVSNATTQPGGLPCPSPPPNAMTRALAPLGLMANARAARCICRRRLKPVPPILYPSISTELNLSLLKFDMSRPKRRNVGPLTPFSDPQRTT